MFSFDSLARRTVLRHYTGVCVGSWHLLLPHLRAGAWGPFPWRRHLMTSRPSIGIPPRSRLVWFLAAILTALAVMAATFMFQRVALAHHAKSGFQYGAECCSLLDCAEAHAEVKATPAGWFIVENGETIPYSDKAVKKSGDELFHVCQRTYKPVGGRRTICLYAPDQAF